MNPDQDTIHVHGSTSLGITIHRKTPGALAAAKELFGSGQRSFGSNQTTFSFSESVRRYQKLWTLSTQGLPGYMSGCFRLTSELEVVNVLKFLGLVPELADSTMQDLDP